MLPNIITAKVDRSIVKHKISNQIAKGKAILEIIIETEANYNSVKQVSNNWMKNTKWLLLELVNELTVAQEFPLFLWSKPYNPEDFYEEINNFRQALTWANEYLKMIIHVLDQSV